MSVPIIFDHHQRQHFKRRANYEAPFMKECADDLEERLTIIKRDFKDRLIIALPADENMMLEADSYDLITSVFDLHAVNDLPGILGQIRKALKPDGLLLAGFPAGDTLIELRDCMMRAENEIYGGASAHIFPFIDRMQAGMLLQRAGFTLPVIDIDKTPMAYRKFDTIINDLRSMGEGNCLTSRRVTYYGKTYWAKVREIYHDIYADAQGHLPVTYERYTLTGWRPE